ncbi:MAG: hypothetical protein MJZ59_04120 [Paludibacteraceae bacterium]|nr:hypothetical protein [Paludibacteraceae bacterium]
MDKKEDVLFAECAIPTGHCGQESWQMEAGSMERKVGIGATHSIPT